MNKNKGRGRLTKEQMNTISESISKKIEELSPILKSEIAAQRTQERVALSDDCSQHHVVLEQRATMVNHGSRRLRDLIEAKKRLENGTYGWCLGCENHIGFKRLAAVPTAAHCIDCMKMMEGGTVGTMARI